MILLFKVPVTPAQQTSLSKPRYFPHDPAFIFHRIAKAPFHLIGHAWLTRRRNTRICVIWHVSRHPRLLIFPARYHRNHTVSRCDDCTVSFFPPPLSSLQDFGMHICTGKMTAARSRSHAKDDNNPTFEYVFIICHGVFPKLCWTSVPYPCHMPLRSYFFCTRVRSFKLVVTEVGSPLCNEDYHTQAFCR